VLILLSASLLGTSSCTLGSWEPPASPSVCGGTRSAIW
jgi:hypothetical protein